MKKLKRILAAAGAILLLLLYASTLVCALSSSENFMNLLMVSIYATVIIPVLLWAYTLIYKLVHKSSGRGRRAKGAAAGAGKIDTDFQDKRKTDRMFQNTNGCGDSLKQNENFFPPAGTSNSVIFATLGQSTGCVRQPADNERTF